MDHGPGAALQRERPWLPLVLVLAVGVLHAGLLLLQTAVDLSPRVGAASSAPQRALTAACAAWWLGVAVWGVLRRGELGRSVALVAPGHAVALSAMGVLSSAPGVPWCATMALVTLPIATSLRWSPRLVHVVLAVSAAGAAATTLDAVGGRAGPVFGAFAAVCTTAAVVAPTLVVLRLDARLRAARDAALLQAVTDPLTGLLNRRGLTERVPHLVGRHPGGAADGTTCVVLLDVDRFKAVNDGSGHGVGDEVLRAVADVLVRHVRAQDLLVRHGGEEFAWVGRWPDAASAVRSAERVRVAVAAAAMPHGRPVTVTLGVAASSSPGPAGDPLQVVHRLVARADSALYAAKRAGRDRVVLAEDDPAVLLSAAAAAPGSAAAGR